MWTAVPGLRLQHLDARLGTCGWIVQDWPMAKPALDLSTLTPDEKLALIDDLWGSLRPEDLALTPEQAAELDRRLENLDRDGPIGVPWEAVRSQMSRTKS